jgi:transcriptional regulator with XRE-family HTH domain
MDGQSDGRALETFVKRQIEASAEIQSLLQLARVSGVRASTMYDWFSGARVPRTETLARVGGVLGVPVSRLLDVYQRRESVDVNEAALAAIEGAVQRGIESAIRRLIDEGVLAPAHG